MPLKLEEDDNESSKEDNDLHELKINKKYAKKKKDDFYRAKEMGLFEDSSDEEDEDENGEELNQEIDASISAVLNMIKKKDPRIYNSSFVPFENESTAEEFVEMPKRKKEKKLTFKDYVREKTMKAMEDGTSLEEEYDGDRESLKQTKKSEEIGYDAKQISLKNAFISQTDATAKDLEEDIFVLKQDAQDQTKVDVTHRPESADKNNKSSSDEDFLKNYLNTKGWVSKYATFDFEKIKENLEEDEDIEEKNEQFEYRHQEKGSEDIISHPRIIEDTMRQTSKKASRKRQRQAKRDRKELAKEEKLREIQRLRKLKEDLLIKRTKETFKISKLNQDSDKVKLLKKQLETEFDEEEHEKLMKTLYNEDFYAEEEDDLFKADIKATDQSEDVAKKELAVIPEEERVFRSKDEERAFWLDQADEEEKEKIDEIGFEDAKLNTKFKYRKVDSQSYGLTAKDILETDDKTLNQLISVKKFAPYREHEWKLTHKKKYRFRKLLQQENFSKKEKKALKKKEIERIIAKRRKKANKEEDDGKEKISPSREESSKVPLASAKKEEGNENAQIEEKVDDRKKKKRKRRKKKKSDSNKAEVMS